MAFARALYGSPRLVVLDEPEIGLDGSSLKRLGKVLAGLKADGVGLVIATQDPRLLALTDKIIVLNGGTVQALDQSNEIVGKIKAAKVLAGQSAGLN